MNNFRGDMVERKEKITGIRVVKIGCMDEDDVVSGGVIKIGVAGSGVVKIGGGNQELYSDKEREGMQKITRQIYRWTLLFSQNNGVTANSSSHPECGAGGAQGFSEENLINETKNLSAESGINYTGHLEIVTNNQDIPRESLSWFTRESGPHTAGYINVTTGGGITGGERELLEKERNSKAFDISADWAEYALKSGIDRNEVVDNLVFQLRLAYAISEGVRTNSNPFRVFNGGRLKETEVSVNEEIVQEVFDIAKKQIDRGEWTAASHH